MLFVRIFSGLIVWLCILLYFGALIVLEIFIYQKYLMDEDSLNSYNAPTTTELSPLFHFLLPHANPLKSPFFFCQGETRQTKK